MTIVAALDCGTNSLRLLIRDQTRELIRRTEIVRLGAEVDRTGRLDPEALERTRVVLADYQVLIEEHGVDRTRLVATSATRDASNRSDFHDLVVRVLGIAADVVTGGEEAGLSFAGAVRDAHDLTAPYLVVDLGGGSTEFILGTHSAEHARSVDVGAVRLTERHFSGQREARLAAAAVDALVADVETALDDVERSVPLREAHSVLCVAGTATTVAALSLGLSHYDPAAIHHAHISADQLCEVTDRLLASTVAEVAALPSVHPGRADVLTAGAVALRTMLDRAGAGGYTASEHDILDGIAWRLIDEQV